MNVYVRSYFKLNLVFKFRLFCVMRYFLLMNRSEGLGLWILN
jgi:hypothetical protein